MNMCKLTICFEDPFWVGIVETQNEDAYNVARHIFGAEPTTPEVEEFILSNWQTLKFSPELIVEKREGKRINPKRLRRIIEKEIAASAQLTRRGTKAQQALAEQRGAFKAARKCQSKEEKLAEQKFRFAQKQAKHKAKHRGH